ncbi:hypothetical protein TSOC_002603 [Tetrabaena socialis]|uniref:Uncharacterized protein n=1 Tax=Tetrabaena socialis TaxID=47790 RepID=A0A2J8ADR8_9CHLO|nr:hypothetical protein TSOC_002603 [Tetrabaena socialis]|eukprot:PNH10646.1 hypothetical protein TSOC_002603 [Tetrabaena socialis]
MSLAEGAGGPAALQQLQEENYHLRMQVSKLQGSACRETPGRPQGGSKSQAPAEVPPTKQPMDLVRDELADLRMQVEHLHKENKSLQLQLRSMRPPPAACAPAPVDGEPWTAAAPSTTERQPEPFTRGDMAFIEREITSLKQKLTETRHKLEHADAPPRPPDYGPFVGEWGEAPPAPAAHPQQRQQRQGRLQALRDASAGPAQRGAAQQQGANALGATGAGAAPLSRNRAATQAGKGSRKPAVPGAQRAMKENRAHPPGANHPVRGKAQPAQGARVLGVYGQRGRSAAE